MSLKTANQLFHESKFERQQLTANFSYYLMFKTRLSQYRPTVRE